MMNEGMMGNKKKAQKKKSKADQLPAETKAEVKKQRWLIKEWPERGGGGAS